MIEYEVVRCKRKTLTLSVGREGNVIVRAPFGVNDVTISEFVLRHASWIAKQLTLRSPRPKFGDGEEVELMGQTLTVRTGRAAIRGGILYLPETEREGALIGLLRNLTRARMKKYLDGICTVHGFSYSRLTVTGARGRWGSCNSKKGISFTFRTAFLPDPLAEYLAVHELCHTVHMDHSDAFWKEVGKVLPDYATRRARLKYYLWAMDCL